MGLILVRHTRPDVAEGVCYGRMDLGVADSFAAEAAAVLSALPEVRRVVSSPLRRCRALARFITDAADLPLAFDGRLKEIDFGAWEGLPWSDVPRREIDAWAENFLHARPHGGESVAMLRCRVGAALADWSTRRGPIAVVTHAGVIKAARAGEGDPAWDFEVPVGFGGIIALSEADQDPAWRPNHD